jgi:hypothetical protein
LTSENNVTNPITTVVTKTPDPIGSPTPKLAFPFILLIYLPDNVPIMIALKSGAPFPNANNVTPLC